MTRKKILLVDDAETVLLVERMALGKEPYELVTAKDGAEAVAKATVMRPDLILMDVVMPKMNGFEACRRLRESEATKDIPIVLVTTRAEAESMQAGFESGCTDYLTKPINGAELLAKVKQYLGQ